jgi:hypothetical protein
MSDEVHKVTVQVRPPKGTFPGEVAIGYYVVFENNVILTDGAGKPIAGVTKHYLTADQDARGIACQMVRDRRKGRASVAGFNRPISYPPLKD